MIYRILKQTTQEPLDAMELHVLVRAYSAAWQHIHESEPIRQHAIPSLDLLIDFVPAEPDQRHAASETPDSETCTFLSGQRRSK